MDRIRVDRRAQQSPDDWIVVLRNEAGTVAFADVIDVIATTGDLPPVGFSPQAWGATIRVLLRGYNGPENLRGLLVCAKEGCAFVTQGARLVKVLTPNLGVTELVFQAPSEDGLNS